MTAYDSIVYGRTNGAVVIISGDYISQDEIRDLLNDEIDFARIIIPLLKRYLPQKNSV